MENIEFCVYKKEDYNIGKWSGGTTTELAIYPPEAKYSERNFLWRISSATVEIEESDFTFLPDYDRILVVLNGEVILSHKNVRVARLAKYEQDRFSGTYETKSYGKITDFNLMVKKGNLGNAEVLTPINEYQRLNIEYSTNFNKANDSFYCAEGFCVISFGEKNCMIKQGQLLSVTYDISDNIDFGVMGDGKTIHTQVFFDTKDNEHENVSSNEEVIQNKSTSDVIKKEKSRITFEDIKWATLLCWSNFRGGKFLFRNMRKLWNDEKLQRAINRIERALLPYLVCLVGFAIVGFGVWETIGDKFVATAIAIWLLVDIIIINPMIYLISLPRPIKDHIKNIDELTEEEKKIEKLRNLDNPKANKILKKYEITGRNKYIE